MMVGVAHHLFDEGLGLSPLPYAVSARPTEHPRMIFVLRLVAVVENLLLLVHRSRAREEQAHADAGALARDRAVRAQDAEHVRVHLLVRRAQRGEAHAQARAVLNHLVAARPPGLEQERQNPVAVVGVDQTERVQRPALGVRRRAHAPRAALSGQERTHQRPPLRELAVVDHAHARGGAEPRPVRRARQPIQILAQKRVHRGTGMHQRVAQHGGAVAHAVPRLHRRADLFQQQQIRVVVREQKLQLKRHGGFAGEHRPQRGARRRGKLRGALLVALGLRRVGVRGVALGLRLGLHVVRGRQLLGDAVEERLDLVLVQDERDLVRQQSVVLLAVHECRQNRRDALRVVEEHQALTHVQVVDLRGGRLVHLDQRAQSLRAKRARGHQRLARLRGVRQALRGIGRLRHRLLQFIQPARLERDADGLAELRVREAPLEHALDDVNQARVDRLGAILGGVASLDVLVDRFGCWGTEEGRGGGSGRDPGEIRVRSEGFGHPRGEDFFQTAPLCIFGPRRFGNNGSQGKRGRGAGRTEEGPNVVGGLVHVEEGRRRARSSARR